MRMLSWQSQISEQPPGPGSPLECDPGELPHRLVSELQFVVVVRQQLLVLQPRRGGGGVRGLVEDGGAGGFAAKRHTRVTYPFSATMRERETTATFTVPGTGDARVEVLGEGRTIEAVGGGWEDRFTGYQAHLYRIFPRPPG